ncbi:MAG TPA: hypothetical protein VG652_06285 [Gaiellaceae bacterium]|nr:hypothetical protein [Gaiellaceae bacterium]
MDTRGHSTGQHTERLLDALRVGHLKRGKVGRRRDRQLAIPNRHHENELAQTSSRDAGIARQA